MSAVCTQNNDFRCVAMPVIFNGTQHTLHTQVLFRTPQHMVTYYTVCCDVLCLEKRYIQFFGVMSVLWGSPFICPNAADGSLHKNTHQCMSIVRIAKLWAWPKRIHALAYRFVNTLPNLEHFCACLWPESSMQKEPWLPIWMLVPGERFKEYRNRESISLPVFT